LRARLSARRHLPCQGSTQNGLRVIRASGGSISVPRSAHKYACASKSSGGGSGGPGGKQASDIQPIKQSFIDREGLNLVAGDDQI